MQVEKAPFYLSELPFIILFYFVKYFIEILMPPAYEFNRATNYFIVIENTW